MSQLTDKDHENLAAMSAVFRNKADSHRTVIPNRGLARRYEDFAKTLDNVRALLGGGRADTVEEGEQK